MAISEQARHELQLRLADVLGPEAAEVLMESLPPVEPLATRADVESLVLATKHDVEALVVSTKHDLEALVVSARRDLEAQGESLRRDLEAQGESLRRDLEAWEVRLGAQISTQGSDLRREMTDMRSEFVWTLGKELRGFTWRMVTLLTGALVALTGATLAAPHL